jgi:hypothetical protein
MSVVSEYKKDIEKIGDKNIDSNNILKFLETRSGVVKHNDIVFNKYKLAYIGNVGPHTENVLIPNLLSKYLTKFEKLKKELDKLPKDLDYLKKEENIISIKIVKPDKNL